MSDNIFSDCYPGNVKPEHVAANRRMCEQFRLWAGLYSVSKPNNVDEVVFERAVTRLSDKLSSAVDKYERKIGGL